MLPRVRIALGSWVLFAVLVLTAASARAQCRDGRVPTTEGACCWPAQAWSEGRCQGPPRCPATLVAEGDACVLPMLALPPPRREIVPVAQVVDSEIPLARDERGDDGTVWSIRHQLVGLGVTHLAIGWTGAAVTGSIYASLTSFGPSCRASHGPWGWIPVVGGLIAGGAIQACYAPWESSFTDWVFFGAATAVQTAGLVMLVIGVVDRRRVPRRIEPTGTGVAIRF